MRCPKCHYLSFDPEPRCRNCGNGLALEDDDLFIREEDEGPAAPFADVSLRATDLEPSPPQPFVPVATAPSARSVSSSPITVDEPRPTIAEDFMPEERAAVHLPPSPERSRPAPTTELPLFVKGMAGGAAAGRARVIDEPLMLLSEEPRPPLAVRRTVQDAPAPKPVRLAPTPESRTKGPLDRDLLSDIEEQDAFGDVVERSRRGGAAFVPQSNPAGAGLRLAAAAIDGALLASLSLAVIWLTLRWCGLPFDRALMLPVFIPTSMFLSLLGVGYLVMFNAAGGQTIGKMAVGLRVVREITPVDAGGPVSFGQALLRAVLTLPSVLVAGAGFLPALVGDERAVHDRLAHTRVIRA